MSTRTGSLVASLFLLVGCSGSNSSGIPAPAQSDEEVVAAPSGKPTPPPANKHSETTEPDSGAVVADAGADAAIDHEEVDAGPSACETCSATSCASQRKACEDDATCPMLKQCLDTCATSACRSDCFVEYPDPEAKAKNGALFKCECVTSCASACKVECG
ncbi:MAG: hypothetical protein K0S65_6441 [Labilithrix sp.]|nr:hypothetical protein [Labilithrix sp.]